MEKPAGGLAWSLKVQAEAHREDDAWVATCPALDVATQGDTRRHAFEMLEEALIGYFECLADLGTLWQVLDRKGLTPTLATVLHAAADEEGARWLDIPIWLLPSAEIAQATVR